MSSEGKVNPQMNSGKSAENVIELQRHKAKPSATKAARKAQVAIAPSGAAPEVLKQTPGNVKDKLARRPLPSAALIEAGKALRDQVPRQAHGTWKRDKDKVDPLTILRASDNGRLEQLIPIRYGRMLQSPFTFYRGSAAVMAADLARTAEHRACVSRPAAIAIC